MREEREAIEAEEGHMIERMKEMKQRIVQLQAEERAEDERHQHDRHRREEAEAAVRLVDEKRRSDRQRWAATLTTAPTHYVAEERSTPHSADSSSDSDGDMDSGGTVRRSEDTTAEMTRLWDEFKHKWTPHKQPPPSAPPAPTTTSSAAAGRAEQGSEVGLQSLTAGTDASIRELTAMLNDMIQEFNITAAAAGDDKPIVVQTADDGQLRDTARADGSSEREEEEAVAAASAASVTAATAAVTARKPSPLSSPASSPTRLNSAQRQRSVERGEAQEAEWHLILQQLKADKTDNREQATTGWTEGARGGANRVGLFVPSIFNARQEREQKEASTDSKQTRQYGARVERAVAADGEEEADGVVYSGLIDFDVNDPHEIDRQRRIEAQLRAETTVRRQQQRRQQHAAVEEEERQRTVSSERVREAISRYKQVGLTAEELDEKAEVESTSEVLSKQAVLEPTVDVRLWLERLERKIDALANQQPQSTLVDGGNRVQRSTKRRTAAAQPAADIFAPVEQPPQQQQRDDNEKREPHKQHSAPAATPIAAADIQPAASRTQRSSQHRIDTDSDSKYSDDEQPRPVPAHRSASTHSSFAPLPSASNIAPRNVTAHSYQRSSAADGLDGSGGGLTLQECFARRMGHIIATDEQRRRARQQQHSLSHAHCTADADYHTAARHYPLPSHTQPASQSANHAIRRRRHGASVQSAAGSAVSAGSASVSSSHRRMQLGERGVISASEARARSARVWRQLPEVRRRREEQRKREERLRSVERRQSYDRQRQAGQHSRHT